MICVVLVAFGSPVVGRAQCVEPAATLVAWWPADGGYEEVIGGHSGVMLNGAAFAEGQIESAFEFDGTDDYVSTDLDVQPSAMPSATWEMWVYPTAVDGRRQILCSDDGGYDRSLLIQDGSFGVFTGSTVWQPVTVDLAVWQHIAVVFTPENIRFFKDGVAFDYGSAPSGQSTVLSLAIGRNPSYGEHFAGRIDEISIYGAALSDPEIAAIAAAGWMGKCPPAISEADVGISVVASADQVFIGESVVYEIDVFNWGFETATGVRVQVPLPDTVSYQSVTGPGVSAQVNDGLLTLILPEIAYFESALFSVEILAFAEGIAYDEFEVFGLHTDWDYSDNVTDHALTILSNGQSPANGDWSLHQVELRNTSEAQLMVRTGDIDNLGFGWPNGFDPFSGNSTPAHAFPWAVDPEDPAGTDRIMVVSSYVGTPPSGLDGYTGRTQRPDNQPVPIRLDYDLTGLTVTNATLQIFVDDFQAPVWAADYQAWLNNQRAPFLENILNSLSQTGPIGKLISVGVPAGYLPQVASGNLEVFIDDPTTGAGDGFAIDFVKLLVNVNAFGQVGTISGRLLDEGTQQPLVGMTVSAAGLVEAVTDESGAYLLNNVPAGLVFVEISKRGYATRIQSVDLVAGQSITLDFWTTAVPELWFRWTGARMLQIAWPAALASLPLQVTTELTGSAGDWTSVNVSTIVEGDEARVTIEVSETSGSAFYRLYQP